MARRIMAPVEDDDEDDYEEDDVGIDWHALRGSQRKLVGKNGRRGGWVAAPSAGAESGLPIDFDPHDMASVQVSIAPAEPGGMPTLLNIGELHPDVVRAAHKLALKKANSEPGLRSGDHDKNMMDHKQRVAAYTLQFAAQYQAGQSQEPRMSQQPQRRTARVERVQQQQPQEAYDDGLGYGDDMTELASEQPSDFPPQGAPAGRPQWGVPVPSFAAPRPPMRPGRAMAPGRGPAPQSNASRFAKQAAAPLRPVDDEMEPVMAQLGQRPPLTRRGPAPLAPPPPPQAPDGIQVYIEFAHGNGFSATFHDVIIDGSENPQFIMLVSRPSRGAPKVDLKPSTTDQQTVCLTIDGRDLIYQALVTGTQFQHGGEFFVELAIVSTIPYADDSE